MENASKALIMAASVLLGVMILSVGVALFYSFSDFSSTTISKAEDNKIAEWNNNYIKYENSDTVTAHDIITVANHAKQNNINYELENQSRYNENTYYVQVDVDKQQNFEKKTQQEQNEFLKNNSLTDKNETKYYTCTKIEISEVTKRVIYIQFQTIK